MRKITTRRSGCLMLFGLVFFLAGTGLFAFQAIPAFLDYWQMRHWPSTEGRLLSAALETHQGDDSTTHLATATYAYDVGGKAYRNDRVAITGGADNIGEFQRELGNMLERKFRDGQAVTVWYDPDDPSDSVLNREMRWGLMGFFTVFLLTFGGVGAGILFWGWRGQRVVDTPEAAEKPWLANPDWSEDGRIRSGARSGMLVLWFFAVLWNLISLPLVFLLPRAAQESGVMVHLFWLFPVIGVGMLVLAVTKTRQWRRFGRTILTMDPFPGSTGGDVGGSIAVNMAWDPAAEYRVTLTCFHSRMSGSGKNRSRRESPVWQDSGAGSPTVAGDGVRIRFRFAVPDGLPTTEEKAGGNYHLWRLNLHAALPGADLDRSYEIPVYATGARSGAVTYAAGIDGPSDSAAAITDLLPMKRLGNQVLVRYPALRNPLRNGLIILFGAVFLLIGLMLWGLADRQGLMPGVMGVIFTTVGLLVVTGGLYALLNTLEVLLDGHFISSIRRVLGVPVRTRRVAYDEVRSIEGRKVFSGTAGGRAIVDYDVEARYPGGSLVLAQHLGAHSAVQRVCEYFNELIGVPSDRSGDAVPRGNGGSGTRD